MLNRMCEKPYGSCRNMYVTIVHGRVRTRTGTNANVIVNVSPSVIWAKKMMTLAMSSPRTHFVIALGHPIGQHRLRHFHESADVRAVHVVHEAVLARSVGHA